jgi:hypothetical protein
VSTDSNPDRPGARQVTSRLQISARLQRRTRNLLSWYPGERSDQRIAI